MGFFYFNSVGSSCNKIDKNITENIILLTINYIKYNVQTFIVSTIECD